jgi:hypothetical protein
MIIPCKYKVYEYQRYQPFNDTWLKPYIVGDPPPWTDGSGTLVLPRESIQLPSDKWEWISDWTVDKETVGGEDDEVRAYNTVRNVCRSYMKL